MKESSLCVECQREELTSMPVSRSLLFSILSSSPSRPTPSLWLLSSMSYSLIINCFIISSPFYFFSFTLPLPTHPSSYSSSAFVSIISFSLSSSSPPVLPFSPVVPQSFSTQTMPQPTVGRGWGRPPSLIDSSTCGSRAFVPMPRRREGKWRKKSWREKKRQMREE